MFQRRVVIIGGLGATGRPVLERLQALSVEAVPASRRTRPAFDWGDRATWPAALDGATAAYVTYPPGLGAAAAADDIGTLAGVAAEMGIEHLVLLSVRGRRRVLRAERSLRAAPLDHTILRTDTTGTVPPDAVASLAVAALCDAAHLNRTYEIDRDGGVLVGDPGGREDGGRGRDRQRIPVPVDSAASRSS